MTGRRKRTLVTLAADTVAAVERFRVRTGIVSTDAALRRLIEIGLASAGDRRRHDPNRQPRR